MSEGGTGGYTPVNICPTEQPPPIGNSGHDIIYSESGLGYCVLCGKDDLVDGPIDTWGQCMMSVPALAPSSVLFAALENIPVDRYGGIGVEFLHFPIGTPHADVWQWIFDTAIENTHPEHSLLYLDNDSSSISPFRYKGYTAETLWDMLKDIPVDDDENIEVQFLHFPPGTDREDIWHWFEDTFDISINNLMFKKNTGSKSTRSTYLEHSIICSDEGYCYCAFCGKDDIANGYVHTWGKCEGISLSVGMVLQSTLGYLYCIEGAGEEYVYLRVLGHDVITEMLTVELVNLLNSGAWIVKHNLMENSMFPSWECYAPWLCLSSTRMAPSFCLLPRRTSMTGLNNNIHKLKYMRSLRV